MTTRTRTLGMLVLAAVTVGGPTVTAASAATTSAAAPGRSQPGRSQAAAAATSAATGAAGTGLHWLVGAPRSTLVVDVVDTTGVRWPVHAASREWSTRHVRYAVVPSCRAGAPCVVVRERAYGRTGWAGLATATSGQMDTFRGPVLVSLNNSYPLTAAQHLAVACHELGHALGLNHTTRVGSCMQPAPQAGQPDGTDRVQLEQLYSPTG